MIRNIIRLLDSNGKFITKWPVNTPGGIAADPADKIYVVNQNSASVEIYSPFSS